MCHRYQRIFTPQFNEFYTAKIRIYLARPTFARCFGENLIIFTALHVMQTQYSEENSVRLSVHLSVTRVHCDKTVERSVQIYTPYERTFIPLF